MVRFRWLYTEPNVMHECVIALARTNATVSVTSNAESTGGYFFSLMKWGNVLCTLDYIGRSYDPEHSREEKDMLEDIDGFSWGRIKQPGLETVRNGALPRHR